MKRLLTFILFCSLVATPCLAPVTFNGKVTLAGKSTLSPPVPWTYYATVFDGVNDWLSMASTPTGLADGKAGAVSFWIKMDAGSSDTTTYFLISSGSGNHFYLFRDSAARLVIYGETSGAANILYTLSSVGAIAIADGWVHVLASWNLATTTTRLYINGVTDNNPSVVVDGTLDYDIGTFFVGAHFASTGLLPASLCEVWFDDTYIDFSDAGNRAKFRTAGGKPVDLGADGSTPTGTAPVLYLRNEVPAFETNVGGGGGMTENGTLVDGGADKP